MNVKKALLQEYKISDLPGTHEASNSISNVHNQGHEDHHIVFWKNACDQEYREKGSCYRSNTKNDINIDLTNK